MEAAVEAEEGQGGIAQALARRDRAMDRGFSLGAHLARVLGVAAAICALGVWLARDASPWLWLTMPVFWVVANFFEWAVHRYLMHRPLQPRMLYLSHAIVHHRCFDGEAQEIRSVADLSVVMMPWYTLLIVFAMASPIAFGAALVGGPGLAGVFLSAAVLYFLLYETIHTLHHLPQAFLERMSLGRGRVVAFLRRHHHHHHQMAHMKDDNFNVTFPVADMVMRTYVGKG